MLRIRLFIALVGVLVGSAATSARADDDATALLAKHRAFVGWQDGDGTLASWRMSGPGVRSVRRGAIFRTTTIGEHYDLGYGFTGTRFWKANENGNVVTLYEEFARAVADENALFDEAMSTLPGTLRRSATIDGKHVAVVRVTPAAGTPVDLYVDPATGAFTQAVFNPDRDSETVTIDGYLAAGPDRKVIGSFHFGNGHRYVFDTIEPNANVSTADLHPPDSKTHWDFAEGDSVPISVVLDTGTSTGQAVHVEATIDGHTGTFLLDSGASGIVLYSTFADTIELPNFGSTYFSGVAGNAIAAQYALVKTIAIGKSILHDTIVSKAVRSGRGRGPDTDGIIGFDVFAHAIVDVDLKAATLTLSDPSKYAPTIGKGAYAFDIDLSEGSPRIRAGIAGATFMPTIDTGNDFLVLATDALLKSGKVVALNDVISIGGTQVENHETLVGVDGSTTALRCSRLNTLVVGPYHYEKALTCFAPEKVFGSEGGLVGFDFLRHFNWTLDYPDNIFVLTPNGA